MEPKRSHKTFQVERISLDEIKTDAASFQFIYNIDGFRNEVIIGYENDLLQKLKNLTSCDEEQIHTFAVNLAALGMHRFGSVLPKSIDFGQYRDEVAPATIKFMNDVMPNEWSEHRYQLEQLDYRLPKIDYTGSQFKKPLPIFAFKKTGATKEKVFVASGSGKDSLLCSLLIQMAEIPHDLVTYLFDLYGDLDEQQDLFNQVNDKLKPDHSHVIRYKDDYFPWLAQRMKAHGISNKIKAFGREKPFRMEAGEMYFMSLALVPLQIVYQAPLQLFGNEKSADAPNLVVSETGEAIAHQWPKSREGEHAFSELCLDLFQGINRMSLTKAIYDVRIFETLFRIGDELPYHTNSCNLQKPWCGSCEKCAYVFAGFSAFGDHEKVVKAFGKDLFQDSSLKQTWRELLGQRGYIPWECVGTPQEMQLYAEKIRLKGIQGIPVDLLDELSLNPTDFETIAKQYGQVDQDHHQLPDWIWQRIEPILNGPSITLSSAISPMSDTF